jgi:arsenical pump membrane protein
VLAILLRLDFKPAAALAFIVACGFVADSTSLPLVISNLVNIVSANFFDVTFGRYAAVMVPVNLVSLAATLVVLWAFFRRDVPAAYPAAALERPVGAIRDPLVFRAAFPLLGVLLLAYFVTAPFGVPVAAVTCAGAAVLLLLADRGRVIPIRKVLTGAPWQIVLFSLGMYLVVYGLRNAGLTDELATGLVWLAGHGPWVATVGTGFAAAILSSVMNNMPSVLIGALSIQQAPDLSPLTRELMVYANVIGCDLGPKFTPIGSLATLLWLHVLDSKGQKITWGQYMKVGLVITPPVLLVTLVALAAWLPLLGTR